MALGYVVVGGARAEPAGKLISHVYIHVGIQVIKGNQAWRQEIREHFYFNDYMHMVSNSISLRPSTIYFLFSAAD